ncbi:MAG: hypothetical protein RhofKO_01090 [Rhodothermales bacterium]
MPKPQEVTFYSQRDLEKAKQKSKSLGWVQGGAVVFVAMMAFQFLGWIPLLLILGAVGFVGYKFIRFTMTDTGEDKL